MCIEKIIEQKYPMTVKNQVHNINTKYLRNKYNNIVMYKTTRRNYIGGIKIVF